jgi:hypothetical protein
MEAQFRPFTFILSVMFPYLSQILVIFTVINKTTYLRQWNRNLIEKPMAAQLVKKILAFYETKALLPSS